MTFTIFTDFSSVKNENQSNSFRVSDMDNNKNLKIAEFWDENDVAFIHIKNDNWSVSGDPWIKVHSGTWDDPHVIENVTINGQNSRSCILIEDSEDFFIINNCTVYNSGAYPNAGIQLNNANNGTIINNYISNGNSYGISLSWSDNNTISNNTVSNCGLVGIWLDSCNNNTIYNNTITNNGGAGIAMQSSTITTISDNNLIYNKGDTEIEVVGCDQTKILNNTIYNPEGRGMFLGSSVHTYVKENELSLCGIKITGSTTWDYSLTDIDTSNSVNNKPIYYYSNEVGLEPDDFTNAGQVILFNCNDSVISDIDVSYGSDGLDMILCNNNTITNVISSYNSNNGIELSSIHVGMGQILRPCDANNFTKNTVENNEGDGMDIREGNFNVISWNKANNNKKDGISISNCNNSKIIYNRANQNYDRGILLNTCHNDTICENMVYKNEKDGIIIQQSENISIIGNDINHNKEAAIELSSTNKSIVVGNLLINNTILVEESGDCNDNLIRCNFYITDLYVEILNMFFSTEVFNISFKIVDRNDFGIIKAEIKMWWNGEDVSNNVTEVGNGIYIVSLTPKIITPSNNPILLNMTISAAYYNEKYFETLISVDPEAIDKNPKPPSGGGGGDDGDGNGEEQQIPGYELPIIMSIFIILGALILLRIRKVDKV